MVPAARWLVVAVVAVALAAVPTLVRAIPPSGSNIGAVALAGRMRAAQDLGWSGEVSSQGSLSVPLTSSAFSSVARLLGSSSDLRVWWRGGSQWRVDRMLSTGEEDLARDGAGIVQWSYESDLATYTPYSAIRLPDDSDVVPVSLAARMLAGARPGELSRLPSRRIAGHSAAGLRLVPADRRSTIGHVDLWGEDRTGLPLRVDVYAVGGGATPVLSTQVTSIDLSRPAASTTSFELTPGVHFSRGTALDEAAGANAFAPFVPPATVARLPRLGNELDFGAVGFYGRGPTAILAIPLRGFVADALGDQLRKSRSARDDGTSISLEAGPISVRLADVAGGHFLLAGTVTPATLAQAATSLDHGVQRTER